MAEQCVTVGDKSVQVFDVKDMKNLQALFADMPEQEWEDCDEDCDDDDAFEVRFQVMDGNDLSEDGFSSESRHGRHEGQCRR
jgi:hypothetical protein